MEAFDALAKKLEHIHFSKTLKLKKDPGTIFISFSIALSLPESDLYQFGNIDGNISNSCCFYPGSMLHAMFSGGFDTKPAEDGSYFIDRDRTHFRYILNYLRTGKLDVPQDETVREELLNEAEFYKIEGSSSMSLLTPSLTQFVHLVHRTAPNLDHVVEKHAEEHDPQLFFDISRLSQWLGCHQLSLLL